jgi:hypothetical protein
MITEAQVRHAENLCMMYGEIFHQVLKTWWFLDIPQVFNWDATLVDGNASFFVRAKQTLPLNNPMVGAVLDDLARSVVDRVAHRAGWNPRAKVPQYLGLVQDSLEFDYTIRIQQEVIELTGGLGFRVL